MSHIKVTKEEIYKLFVKNMLVDMELLKQVAPMANYDQKGSITQGNDGGKLEGKAKKVYHDLYDEFSVMYMQVHRFMRMILKDKQYVYILKQIGWQDHTTLEKSHFTEAVKMVEDVILHDKKVELKLSDKDVDDFSKELDKDLGL